MLCCSHWWCDFYIYLLLILLLLFSLLLYSCYYCKKLRKLLPSWFKIGDIQRVFPKYLHFWGVIFRICLENFRKGEVILRNICERPIANHGFCNRNRICHFSPIGMLCSWANALYSEIKVFLAGSYFSCQASPQSHIGRRLASRSFTFVLAVEYEILLAD